MPDVSGPFDNAAFLQAPWYRDRGYLEPSGVAGMPAGPGAGELGLTAAGFGLTLALGRAHVRGAYYERTGTAWTDTVPANTSATGPRRDLLVLRRNLTAKTVTPVRVQGTAAAVPVDPALTRVEDGTWDLPIFRLEVPPNSGTPLAVTDLRRFTGADGVGVDAPVAGGWTVSTQPRSHLAAAGLMTRLSGSHGNAGAFTPDATQYPVTVAEGMRPALPQVFAVPFLAAGGGSAGFVLATMLPDGRLRYDKLISGPNPIPAGSLFFLDSVQFLIREAQ